MEREVASREKRNGRYHGAAGGRHQYQKQGRFHLARDVLSPQPHGGVPDGVRADGARVGLLVPGGCDQPGSGECSSFPREVLARAGEMKDRDSPDSTAV